jgi:hypothetical protein
MDGVITAIVAFIFVCILFPAIVKNRPQFYAAFGLVIGVIFLWTLAVMFESAAFSRFLRVMDGLLTIGALLLLVLSTGGLSLKDLGGEFKNAFEVIRRGESAKEVIVPLTGEMPKPRKSAMPDDVADARPAHTVDVPTPVSTPAAQARPLDSSSIPLE